MGTGELRDEVTQGEVTGQGSLVGVTEQVEHRIASMMQLGMRQARYWGRHKTLFQALTTAAVANLTLIAGKVCLLAGAEISTSAQRAASAAAKTPQTAFQSDRALLRAARGRLRQLQFGGDRPVRPSILAFVAPVLGRASSGL